MENIKTEAYLSDLDFSYDGTSDIYNESQYIGTDALITLSIPFDVAQKIMNYARENKARFKLTFEPISNEAI